MNEGQISKEFFMLLEKAGNEKGFNCEFWHTGSRRFSKKIIKLSGTFNYLIYFKVRSAKPIRWGVTANRIKELDESGVRWWLVLLFESPYTGYLLSSEDVDQYKSIWPLVKDGDYKVQPGGYLRFHDPFYTFLEFMKNLIK